LLDTDSSNCSRFIVLRAFDIYNHKNVMCACQPQIQK
jgi:hypothetical protein